LRRIPAIVSFLNSQPALSLSAGTALHAPFPSLAKMQGMHLLSKPGDQPEWQFRQKLFPVIH
jgi:hypothetical protein